ncbi:MAG: hypothetical protein ABSC08_01545 [Bryobacteraceae bacterium]|jgi:hypothetical protein
MEQSGAGARGEWRATAGPTRGFTFAFGGAIQPLIHRAAHREFTVKAPHFTVFLP